MNILVLCHGNICRSPIAAAILMQANCFTIRQGGFATEGRRSPPKIRDAAARMKLSLEDHRSRLATKADARWASIILYMDNGNYKRILKNFPDMRHKARSLASFGGRTKIPDPNFMSDNSREFYECMSLIEYSCKQFRIYQEKEKKA